MAVEKKKIERIKVKVLKRFKDKYTGKAHVEGEILTIKKERYEEILKVGKLVEIYDEKAADKAEKTAK